MTTRRIDFIDTDLQTGWGDLNASPKHEPVLRPDSAQCCGDCGQGRKACPSPMVCMGLHRVELANGQTLQAKPSARATAERQDVQRAQRVIRRTRFLRHAFPWIAAVALVLAVATVTMSAAHAADAETTATVAAGADTVSTIAAVGSGAAVEANGLIAAPPVFLAVAAIKLAAPRLTRDMEPETRRTTLRSMSALWGGAAANNLAILAGIGFPVCVGVAVGAWLWITSDKQPEPTSAPEAGAAVAMVQP